MKKIGFIINPVAGLGGRAGFKGSDNIQNQAKALQAGYEKQACSRAEMCLQQIKEMKGYLLIAPGGEMGGNTLKKLGISYQEIEGKLVHTTKEDTIRCLLRFMQEQVDLIVFCGGDGTARDVCEICKDTIPVLGIPAGVKMYSACFAINPLMAGLLLKEYLQNKAVTFQLREVMDMEEELLGKYAVSARLYGYLFVLNREERLQGKKAAASADPDEAEHLAKYLVTQMRQDVLYIIGPGSTTYKIKEMLAGDGTLVGVDALKNGKLIGKDVDEKRLLEMIKNSETSEIIVTCIGGAGFVFGRGNQQISPEIIKSVKKEQILLAVTKSKLLSLGGRPMLVDTGDAEVDTYLSGYYRIHFHANESTVYKIATV